MTPQALRDSIIHLAIQGKLVEQRKDEGLAEVLKAAIEDDRNEKIRSKIAKVNKKIEPITEDALPFEIPDSWEWIRFGELVSYNMGKTPPRAEPQWWGNDFPWVAISDMPENGHITQTKECVSTTAITEKFSGKISKAGTLLMSFKLTVGRVSILDVDAVHNEAIISIYPYADEDSIIQNYLFKLLPYISKFGESKNAIKGKTLNDASISNLLIPLPPLAEQKRIVAKIEELLPLVDRYEKAWNKLEEFNKRFPVDMQKSLLQMAIQGKLVEQRPEEGTGEELYQQIQAEKQQLIKDKKIKKEKALPEITEDEIPFDIPENWKWVHIGDVFSVGTGMTPLKSELKFYINGTIPWITSSLTSQRYIKVAETYVTDYALENTSLTVYPSNTLIVAMYGQGKTRGQISELLIDATINQACAALGNIIVDRSFISYVYYFFLFNYEVLRKKADGTSQPNLNLTKIQKTLMPLPPLAEQKRIVAKLEELLPLCDRLK